VLSSSAGPKKKMLIYIWDNYKHYQSYHHLLSGKKCHGAAVFCNVAYATEKIIYLLTGGGYLCIELCMYRSMLGFVCACVCVACV